jgi:hypothetical protein
MRRFFVKMSAAAIIAASTVAALQGGASASTHVPVSPSSSTVYTGHVTSPGRTFVPAPKPGQCGGCLA